MDQLTRNIKKLKKKGARMTQKEVLILECLERERRLSSYSEYELARELKFRKRSLDAVREDLAEFCGFDIRTRREKIADFFDKYQNTILGIMTALVIPMMVGAVVAMIYKAVETLS